MNINIPIWWITIKKIVGNNKAKLTNARINIKLIFIDLKYKTLRTKKPLKKQFFNVTLISRRP